MKYFLKCTHDLDTNTFRNALYTQNKIGQDENATKHIDNLMMLDFGESLNINLNNKIITYICLDSEIIAFTPNRTTYILFSNSTPIAAVADYASYCGSLVAERYGLDTDEFSDFFRSVENNNYSNVNWEDGCKEFNFEAYQIYRENIIW